MNLVELIAHYQSILKQSDREDAGSFLRDADVPGEVQKAIIACFDDDGNQLTTC